MMGDMKPYIKDGGLFRFDTNFYTIVDIAHFPFS